MDSRYEHQKYEERIYQQWEKSGAFTPKEVEAGEVFSIIMPPPNANDPLHVGHAMFVTIEDVLIRHERMRGKMALWLPGTDHAGIETQYVFEKKLKKQGKSRFQFDRETLYRMIWKYVQENAEIALRQMRRLGASADWTRTKFTLDPMAVEMIWDTFVKMHKDGLIYRDYRLVNYCVKCGTGYSDLEVVYREQEDPLYWVKYGEVTVATVRPETIWGDTAVAINPRDKRESLKNAKAINPLTGEQLPIIEDGMVEMEFGSGVVKITPAHDDNDYEAGKRHGLPLKQVIGFDGKMMEAAGRMAGLKVLEARARVVEDLQKRGLIEKTKTDYCHKVMTCYRCGELIEPLPLPQFWVKVKPLTEMALRALEEKEVVVYGAGHDKILRTWLKTLRDWNISRQVVWGIRIPVWYEIPDYQNTKIQEPRSKQDPKTKLQKNKDIVVGFLDREKRLVRGRIGDLLNQYSFEEIEAGLQTLMAPEGAEYMVSKYKPGEGYLQETDTFDTWFSSSQWPVVALKAQKSKVDFEKFYPTNLMETGYDILPFWVMRMMMMGLYLTGKVPFLKVYLHGLVRDELGRKMSKSKGNVIDPLLLADKYGADALRMALIMSTTAGHDSAVGENKVKGMRNFSNKIWNGARLVKMSLGDKRTSGEIKDEEYRKYLTQVIRKISKQLADLKVGLAAETAHNEFWHWWCDEVLESYKRNEASDNLVIEGTKIWLKLLHPFMPFVSEAVWKEMGYEGLLIEQRWPSGKDEK